MRAVYQARIALMFGLGVMLIGLLKINFGTGDGAAPFLSFGFVVFFVGGIVRLWTRRQWLAAISSQEEAVLEARRRLLSGIFGGFWSFWLGVSRDGARID